MVFLFFCSRFELSGLNRVGIGVLLAVRMGGNRKRRGGYDQG